ncbi:uncharacterized protein LOC106642910 [Copidosoma floridanum]|uniref:uncharacterized protein LOC106642910 n=1 Tax=Copidosoma floridanum TaxID=29053 RepID=UPI0006C97E1D|nr:uncharacterized protein LOC106642910 [Copidosoma floridanum]
MMEQAENDMCTVDYVYHGVTGKNDEKHFRSRGKSQLFTLLIGSVCCALAQYGDEPGTPVPKKPLQIPGARRIKGPRLAGPTAQTSIGASPRFRRPVPVIKPRAPASEPIPEIPVFTSGIRGSRPSSLVNLEQNDEPQSLPIQAIQQPHIVHAQSVPQQGLTEIKPVSEVHEKDEDVVQVIANLGAVSNYGAQGNLLTATTASPAPILPTASAYLQEQQQHQQHQQQFQIGHYRALQPQQHQISRSSANVVLEQPKQINHQVITPVQYSRPQKPVRLSKPQQQLVERNEYDLNEARPVVKQRAQVAPKKSKPQADYYEGRTKKPVAQVIRRYREEMADGSILWGFENDDGSFKEEMIGIDCITRGKYGYVDPDGLKREYTYETGIKCDEEAQQQQDQDILNTFVDYQENKLVLPNGKTIDLSSMGKKQARRPQPLYRN